MNGNGSITAVDALCTLRQVAALPATTNCLAPPSGPPTSPPMGALPPIRDRWPAPPAALLLTAA
ncbi:MAG: hypothetical protein HY690_19970 [Chloroflexi bacterium]|nr:hypothetical protein [Chloroflexota bacterium]